MIEGGRGGEGGRGEDTLAASAAVEGAMRTGVVGALSALRERERERSEVPPLKSHPGLRVPFIYLLKGSTTRRES